MIHRVALQGFGRAWKKEKQHQRKTRNDAYPAKENPALFNAFQKLVDKKQQQKHQHAELKQHAQLIICPEQTLNEHKLVKRQHTQYKPFDNRIGKVKPECAALLTTNVGGKKFHFKKDGCKDSAVFSTGGIVGETIQIFLILDSRIANSKSEYGKSGLSIVDLHLLDCFQILTWKILLNMKKFIYLCVPNFFGQIHLLQ